MADSLKAPILSQEKQSVGELELPADVFGRPLRSHLLYETVKMQLANRRAGTSATKTRAFVRGGGKKPWKQKGTGRARQGSTRATQWVGGATVFGPQPRDYSYRLPRTARKEAIATALSQKLRQGELVVLDKLAVPSGKTKDMAKMLATLGLQSVLLVLRDEESGVARAARNLPRVKVVLAAGLNVYDVLRYQHVVLTADAVGALGERYA